MLKKQTTMIDDKWDDLLHILQIFGREEPFDRKFLQTVRYKDLVKTVSSIDKAPHEFVVQLAMKNAESFLVQADIEVDSDDDDSDNSDSDSDSDSSSDSDSDSDKKEKKAKKDTKEKAQKPKNFHTRDLLSLLLMVSDPTARQLWAKNLLCLNKPLEVVSPIGELMLWQLSGLTKSWSDVNKKSHYAELLFDEMSIIGCVTLGKCQSTPEMINRFILTDEFSTYEEVFFDEAKVTKTTNKAKDSLGAIDTAWLTPILRPNEEPEFTDLIAVMNLRGNANDFPNHLEFLRHHSNVLVVMYDTEDDLKKSNLLETECYHPDIQKEMAKIRGFIEDDGYTAEEVKESFKTSSIASRDGWEQQIEQIVAKFTPDSKQKSSLKLNGGCKNIILVSPNKIKTKVKDQIKEAGFDKALSYSVSQDFLKKLRKRIFKGDKMTPTSMTAIRKSLSLLGSGSFQFRCDLDGSLLGKTEKAAEEFIKKALGDLNNLDKEKVTPLSHPKLWGVYSKTMKQVRRIKFSGDSLVGTESVDEQIATLEAKCAEIRDKQRKMASQSCVFTFLDMLQKFKAQSNQRALFIDWLALKLNSISNRLLVPIRGKYMQTVKEREKVVEKGEKAAQGEMKAVDEKLQGIENDIVRKSVGLEHIFREIGQYFECMNAVSEPQDRASSTGDHWVFAKAIAELMIQGVPMEGMDGDNSFIQTDFLSAVFQELQNILGKDSCVTSMGILGTQSTGKSTYLNAMYNFNFAVAAARCTKGINFQLVPIDPMHKKADSPTHLLVLDTEGLKAPLGLSREEANRHDNEMATAVIGLSDLTMVNVFNAIDPAINDILGVMIPAAFDLKKSRHLFEPKIIFVHQNVETVHSNPEEVHSAALTTLKNELDEQTANQCLSRGLEKTSFGNHISKLVHEFIDPLKAKGSGYSPDYVRRVQAVKKKYINNQKCKVLTFKDTANKITQLWDNILDSNWVISFSNIHEIVADKKFSEKYANWVLDLNQDAMQKAVDILGKLGDNNPNGLTLMKLNLEFDNITHKMQKKYKDKIQEFVSSMDNSFMNERQGTYEKRIERRIEKQVQQEASLVIYKLQSINAMIDVNDAISQLKDKLFNKVISHINSLPEYEKEKMKNEKDYSSTKFDAFWSATLAEVGPTLPKMPPPDQKPKDDAFDLLGTRYDNLCPGRILTMEQNGLLAYKKDQNFYNAFVTWCKADHQKELYFQDIRGGFSKNFDFINLWGVSTKDSKKALKWVMRDLDKCVASHEYDPDVNYQKSRMESQLKWLEAEFELVAKKFSQELKGFKLTDDIRCTWSALLLHKLVPAYDAGIQSKMEAEKPIVKIQGEKSTFKKQWDDIIAGVSAAERAATALCQAVISVIEKNLKGKQKQNAFDATKKAKGLIYGSKRRTTQALMDEILQLHGKGNKSGFDEARRLADNQNYAVKVHIRNTINQSVKGNTYFKEYIENKMISMKNNFFNSDTKDGWLADSTILTIPKNNLFTHWKTHIITKSSSDWFIGLQASDFITSGTLDDEYFSHFVELARKEFEKQWTPFKDKWAKESQYSPSSEEKTGARDLFLSSACGCQELCPFCSSPCDGDVEHANLQHSCKQHKLIGTRGLCYHKTNDLINDYNCIDWHKKNYTWNDFSYTNKEGKRFTEAGSHNMETLLARMAKNNYHWDIPKDESNMSAQDTSRVFWEWIICAYEKDYIDHYSTSTEKKVWKTSVKQIAKSDAQKYVNEYYKE